MDYNTLIKTIIELVKSSPKLTILLLFMTILAGFFPLITIYSISKIVDSLLSNDNIFAIYYIIIWIMSLCIPAILSNIILIVQSSLSENMFVYLSSSLTKTLNNIGDLNRFEDEEIYKDMDILKSNISNRPVNFIVTIASITTSLITILSIAISLLDISIYIPILSLILGVIVFYTSSKGQKELWAGSLSRSYQSRMMNYIFSLSIDRAAMQEIRIVGFHDFLRAKFDSMHEQTKAIMNRIRLKIGYLAVITTVSILLISTLMIMDVMHLISIGSIPIASIVFLLQAIQSIQMNTRNASEQLGWMSGHLLFFEKYFLYKKVRTNENPSMFPVINEPIQKIELRNCSFNYNDHTVLDNISLTINKGDIIAVVGQNGAGKTTLVRILMGLLKPSRGELLINDKVITDFGLRNYWKKCSFVPQLFAQIKFTLEESILVGRADILNKSYDTSFLTTDLPNKDQQLGKEFNGTDLSGGQWQKIAILRSLINHHDTDILFFDEPTSAIDPLVEESIYNLIEDIAKEKLTVYITHRMSTVTHSNRVLLVGDKGIIADGPHREIYKINDLYKEMFDAQAKRFQKSL